MSASRKRPSTKAILITGGIAAALLAVLWNSGDPETNTETNLNTEGTQPVASEATDTPGALESATPAFTPDYNATAVVMGTALAQQEEGNPLGVNSENSLLQIFDIPPNGQLPEGACVLFYDQTKYVLPPFEGPYTKAECVAGAWNVGEYESLLDRNSDGDHNDTFTVSSPERRFR